MSSSIYDIAIVDEALLESEDMVMDRDYEEG